MDSWTLVLMKNRFLEVCIEALEGRYKLGILSLSLSCSSSCFFVFWIPFPIILLLLLQPFSSSSSCPTLSWIQEDTCPIGIFSYHFLIMKKDFWRCFLLFRPAWMTLGKESSLMQKWLLYQALHFLQCVSQGKQAKRVFSAKQIIASWLGYVFSRRWVS